MWRDACSFFFQAEDGIRDLYVTGVQTCALPILSMADRDPPGWPEPDASSIVTMSARSRRATSFISATGVPRPRAAMESALRTEGRIPPPRDRAESADPGSGDNARGSAYSTTYPRTSKVRSE